MKYNYKFSIIIPIYNVEEYLEETILSVVNQTIGFKKNIQMILVNDGSPDNSENICLKYKRLYPNNIIYIKQKKAGVSAARNKGLKYATGEIINFLDSDDKWENTVFEEVYRTYLNNNNVKIFSCKMKYFDAYKGNHPLNYKYKKNKIIDILLDWEYPQLSGCSVFIHRDAIRNYRFDTKIKYSEDNKFINEIILEEKKYMVLKNPVYYYRRRLNGSSAIQNVLNSKEHFMITPINIYKYLYDLSIKKYGKVIKYIQNIIMYEYQWRIKEMIPDIMSSEEIKEYKNISINLLKEIDDDIILLSKNLWNDYKTYIFELKYNFNIFDKCFYDNGLLKYNELKVYNITNESVLNINNINIIDNKIIIAGQINSILKENDYKITVKINDDEKILKLNESTKKSRYSFNELLYTNKTFKIEFELNTKYNEIEFYIQYKDYEPLKLKLNCTLFSHISTIYSLHHKYKNYMTYSEKNKIIVCKNNKIKSFYMELKVLFEILMTKTKQSKKAFVYRILYHVYKLFNRKKIWLIEDRTSVANDNAMHLFKFITKQKNKDIKPYFVIDKESKDYKEIKKYGKVIAYNSLKYKMYFLLSDKIISSQADAWVYNAFGKSNKYYRDLYNFDFIFLQHGITKDDISSWLNYYDKDIKIFITAVKDEYDSIINTPSYAFDNTIVKLTGFPRYDNLTDESKNIIAIMPTWRQYLSGLQVGNTGTREYNSEFINSEYYKFYNSLINDKKLLSVMRKKQMKGIFVVHPSLMKNFIDFKGNDIIEIVEGFADYQKIFRESKLLISDYSSVPFDFAYLHKPVVYTQFDKETFFANHLYDEGYFSYEKNGFGPVVYNYNDTINTIINYINKDCIIEKKYENRIKEFYTYNDRKNCERVYKEILKLKK